MALFTDGPPATVEDLVALDSQLLTVANVEGIDVTQKLELAHQELGLELTAQLKRWGNYEEWLWVSQYPKLNCVVVSPALKLWHSYRSLEMVYRDAYNSQLNDRYAGKRDQFQKMAVWAYRHVALIGLGMVQRPLPKAQPPTVSLAQPQGASLPDGTYYVAISWLNPSGEEGAASDIAAVTVSNNVFLVNAGVPPVEATAWNVFVGSDPNSLALQNSTPLEAGTLWTQENVPNMSGRPPAHGQRPSYERTLPPIIQRG